MLSLISLGRAAWAKVQAAHPAIRWGGAILLGLVVLEFIAQEAINLYAQMMTVRAQIEQANEQAAITAAQRRALTNCTPSDSYIKAVIKARKEGQPPPPREKCAGRD
jgi:hypothetical protein